MDQFLLLPVVLLLIGVTNCVENSDSHWNSSLPRLKRVKRNEEEDHYDSFGKKIDPSQFALENFYSFHVRGVNGKLVDLLDFKGKVSLVVNVASEDSRAADIYAMLVRFQNKFGPSGFFTVLAFPSNQFNNSEPMENKDIELWTRQVFKANFPIFAKINVTFDGDMEEVHHPPEAWAYLDGYKLAPEDNFCMYLVDHMGDVREYIPPNAKEDMIVLEIEPLIEKARKWYLEQIREEL